MVTKFEKDLIVLVADKDMDFAVRGLLSRCQSMKIRHITFDIIPGLKHDPDVLLRNFAYLRNYQKSHNFALVMLDKKGCGKDQIPRTQLESLIENNMDRNGWRNRNATIVIDPELEIWVWSNSKKVDYILGWSGKTPLLRSWLVEEGYCKSESSKPIDPKFAMRNALRKARKKISAVNFKKLSEQVSLTSCSDPSFHKFQNILKKWFSQDL